MFLGVLISKPAETSGYEDQHFTPLAKMPVVDGTPPSSRTFNVATQISRTSMDVFNAT